MENMPQRKLTLKTRLLNLWRNNSSPHEIALGMAIGVFIGITPFYGFHIITAVITAFAMKRVNKLAIFLGMNISLPPTIPFITWAGYWIGRQMLGSAYPSLGWDYFKHFSYSDLFRFFYALVLGSFILGVMLSGLIYFLTLWFVKNRRAKVTVAKMRG